MTQNLFTLKMEEICTSETYVLTRAAQRRHPQEDSSLYRYRSENTRSYELEDRLQLGKRAG
jgi:hypothetical protein